MKKRALIKNIVLTVLLGLLIAAGIVCLFLTISTIVRVVEFYNNYDYDVNLLSIISSYFAYIFIDLFAIIVSVYAIWLRWHIKDEYYVEYFKRKKQEKKQKRLEQKIAKLTHKLKNNKGDETP